MYEVGEKCWWWGGRGSFGNGFVITRLTNLSRAISQLASTAPICDLFIESCREFRREKYRLLFISLGRYQLSILFTFTPFGMLYSSASLKHSCLCWNLWWKALKKSEDFRVVWWSFGHVKDSFLFDGFCVRFRGKCLYTAAFTERGLLILYPSWLQQCALAGVDGVWC